MKKFKEYQQKHQKYFWIFLIGVLLGRYSTEIYYFCLGILSGIQNFNFSKEISENWKDFFENLDLSIFQNAVIGILTLLIPFVIVLLQDQKKENGRRDNFGSMVVLYEILYIKITSPVVIVFFLLTSLFSSENIPALLLLITVFFFLIAILFLILMKGILEYIRGRKENFEIQFLKKTKAQKRKMAFSL